MLESNATLSTHVMSHPPEAAAPPPAGATGAWTPSAKLWTSGGAYIASRTTPATHLNSTIAIWTAPAGMTLSEAEVRAINLLEVPL